jgi:hypothetical protein
VTGGSGIYKSEALWDGEPTRSVMRQRVTRAGLTFEQGDSIAQDPRSYAVRPVRVRRSRAITIHLRDEAGQREDLAVTGDRYA